MSQWLGHLGRAWRLRAQNEFVSEEVRRAFRYCAEELEEMTRAHDNELLTPKQAASECFLAEGTVRNWIASGKLTNEGEAYKPLVRRKALHAAVNGRAERELHAV